ncbi:alpha/beta fold hydrolase [Antrihabitans sp. YC2-6]|uniref:alpha/beta fold hydrolase n=1 Tax=Antrihabitans sp. YC2-6 TaxID=2799498 RepID=UPI0018F3950A|nr:alpha/beta hydrolase [Antrihabitans sp. YC2-6]
MIGGTASAVALVGVGAARAVQRSVRPKKPDNFADENFALIDEDRARVVRADDGVELAVRESGPEDAPLTVIFSHGFSNRMTSFHLQRRMLADRWGDNVRLVFHDLRGHGLSGMPADDHATIDQLAADLETVVRVVAPTGPVVLVGHSMGGMSILAAARQFPELFAAKVVGVGLLSTAAEGIARRGIARNLAHPAVDGFRLAVRTSPALVQFGRATARNLIWPILHAASFRTDVSPSIAKFTYAMIDGTSVVTVVQFLRALELHDETESVAVLADLPALVLAGDADPVIPFSSATGLAAALPNAELVQVHHAGHMVHLEFPELVNDALDRLVDRATEFVRHRNPSHVG